MKKINDKQQVAEYIRTYALQDYMNTDLAQIAELLEFERSEYLIEINTPSNYLYFLIKGTLICSSYTTNDKLECMAYYQAPAIAGEAASLWNMPPAASVKALSHCTCIAVNLTQYRHMLIQDLRFLQYICKTLACRVSHEGQLCTTLVEPLDMRLAKFMLTYSTDHIFTFQLNDCADILNTSYRHLLRMIKKFSTEGYITKTRNGYLITNEKQLQTVANGSHTANF